MPFAVRSLDEIGRAVRGAIRQYLPGTDASLAQNVLSVIGKVTALLAHEYELRLQWIFRQLFLSTASREDMIRLHAGEYGVTPLPAAAAAGLVTGTGAPHTTYPAGIRYVSATQSYLTAAPFTADAAGVFLARVRAERPGVATNRDAGAVLALAEPALWPALSAGVAVGDGGLGGGADAENMEALRRRALKRKAEPPQGGALSDYERFVLEVPGTSKVWARSFAGGAGTVGAWVLMEQRINGIPTDADLAAIEASIEGRRLVRARFAAVAPSPVPVDLSVSVMPETVAMRAAVLDALTAFFDVRRTDTRLRPGLPLEPFTLPVAWISEAISGTAGETSHRLTSPASDLTFQPGELPVLGTIDWGD